MEYSVSPGYFHAAGTTLLQGRAFTWDDKQGAPRAAVVNREFARALFGSEANAIDNSFKFGDGTRVRVVGIVEDGKYKTLSEDPQPAMFLSILQSRQMIAAAMLCPDARSRRPETDGRTSRSPTASATD